MSIIEEICDLSFFIETKSELQCSSKKKKKKKKKINRNSKAFYRTRCDAL